MCGARRCRDTPWIDRIQASAGAARKRPLRGRHAAMAELISFIVTTYQRPDALAAVLRGLAAQTDRDFEVIVADDGSGAEPATGVATWRETIPVVEHVWQENKGFRAAAIRNRAVVQSRGALCIFLD